MGDKIHPTHFQVTKDMPWREKEKQALKLLQQIFIVWNDDNVTIDEFLDEMLEIDDHNQELIQWIRNYDLG